MRKIKNVKNISNKFIMLADKNQLFRNCFVNIRYHLAQVSTRINKCLIFEPNKLYDTIYSMVKPWDQTRYP